MIWKMKWYILPFSDFKPRPLHVSPAGSPVVTHGWVMSVPQREHLLLGVVVVVPAFMAVVRPGVFLVLGLILPLPHIWVPVQISLNRHVSFSVCKCLTGNKLTDFESLFSSLLCFFEWWKVTKYTCLWLQMPWSCLAPSSTHSSLNLPDGYILYSLQWIRWVGM